MYYCKQHIEQDSRDPKKSPNKGSWNRV